MIIKPVNIIDICAIMKILSLLLCVILLTASVIFAVDSSSPDCEPTFTAIFGSCNKHNLDQSYWNKLLQKIRQLNNDKDKQQNRKPSCNSKVSDKKEIDVISWLGDVIYSDYQTVPVGSHFTRVNESEMANRWHTMKNHQEYQNILKVTRSVNGLYDDHDMGLNDAGKELDIKKVSQNHLLDFIDVPKAGEGNKEATVRRNRDGVYAFHKYPIKLSDTASAGNVCFLMIDARTHRDHPKPDGKGDMLGEKQWTWLESVLKTGRDPEIEESDSQNSNGIRNIDDVCAVTFLSTGVQVIADSQPMENWGEFPETRDRLLRLLQKSGASKFIILSGDTHMAELNKLSATKIALGQKQQEHENELYNKCGESPFEYNHLYEVTSSGLTHHVHPLFGSPDRFDSWFPSHRRVGQMYPLENAGIITVKCRGLDTRTCDVNVYVVAIPDPSLPWDEKTSTMSEIIHLNVNFALDSAELMRHQLQTLVSDEERKECADLLDYGGKKGTYKLPVYYAPWTQAIMLTKKLIPYFEEETRLHIIFFHMWVLIGCLTIVLRIVWSCLCSGGRRNKTENQKQKKE